MHLAYQLKSLHQNHLMKKHAGDAATVILPPLAAMIFIKIGYHPIAGLAMAYASSLGGFCIPIKKFAPKPPNEEA
jgi:p-aminobenzoyl-glutamate transporter AbgT